MGTIRSNKTWEYDERCEGYDPGTLSWEFSTTVDILTLKFCEKKPDGSSREYELLIGADRAGAILEALHNWASEDL